MFTKNRKELESLIQVVSIYSDDIGMEFSIEKCAMLIMKSGRRQMTKEIELTRQEKIGTLGEQETYKYLRIMVADTNKQMKSKEKIK